MGRGERDDSFFTRAWSRDRRGRDIREWVSRCYRVWCCWLRFSILVVWGPDAAATQPYLNGSEASSLTRLDALISLIQYQYGDAFDTSHFGGPVVEATFISSNSSDPNTVFRILSDNTTVTSFIDSIDQNCSSRLSLFGSNLPSPFNINSPNVTQPEQAIQYYRASGTG